VKMLKNLVTHLKKKEVQVRMLVIVGFMLDKMSNFFYNSCDRAFF